MASRRLALVIGSQCAALPPDRQLSFLPAPPGPVDQETLAAPQRLLVKLRDLLVDGPGECAPVAVAGQSGPGLLLNPTKDAADAALAEAMSQAHEHEAVLVVHFLGHGTGHQGDPAASAQHLLHVWDTIAAPIDTEEESNGWDPYEVVRRRWPHIQKMVGLVLLVDACRGSWAKQQVEAWSGVRDGLLSACLVSSGDQPAWDACFTRSLIKALELGVSAAEHPRHLPVAELLATDLVGVVEKACQHQRAWLGGYENYNLVLFVARNRRASQLAEALGLDGSTETLLLRLSEDYVAFAIDSVVEAVQAQAVRVLAVVGGPGTGKSTLAAALRRPPTDEVPLTVVQAIAFISAPSSVPELTRTLRGQLDRLPAFDEAARRYRSVNAARWDTLDPWQQQIVGPLTFYPPPVRLLVDGLDQLEGQREHANVLRALTTLTDSTEPALGHVSLVLTGRTVPPLPGIDRIVCMPALDEAAAHRYLQVRHLDPSKEKRLVALAAGNWLVLRLAADLTTRRACNVQPDTLDQLYTDLLDRLRDRQGAAADVVLKVLAAAGAGPVLPFDVLAGAVRRLGLPLERAELHALLGDPDLYRVIDRARPGSAEEHLGLFHQTLVAHVLAATDIASAHRALADTLQELASRHDPKDYRSDPLLRYAFNTGPQHRWEAGQPERLVADLGQREDVVPRVNLARWGTWSHSIRERLGADHPDTLTTRRHISHWAGEAGQPAKALRLCCELLPDVERVLGPEHPDTLTTRHHIARVTGQAGKPAEALRLLRALLPDRVRVLGPDHSDSLRTRRRIAYWTGEAGDPAKALRLFRELLPNVERVLGSDHPTTLSTGHNIAYWTGEAGDPAEALRLFRALLPDIKRGYLTDNR